MPSDKKPRPQNPHRLLIIVMFIAACFVISGMVYVMQLSTHITKSHAHLASISEQAIGNMAAAHLWLEETLSSNNPENTHQVYKHFKHIEQNFNLLKTLAPHHHVFLSHNEVNKIPSLLATAQTTFKQLQDATQNRLSHAETSTAGSVSDQIYDKLFKQFNTQSQAITRTLQSSLNKHTEHLDATQTLLIFISLFILLAATWMILELFKKQHSTFAQYRALVEQSPFSIQIMSPTGDILQVNQAWENLWKTTMKELGEYNIFQDLLVQKSAVFDDIKRGFSGENVVTPVVNFNTNNTSSITSPYNNCFVRTHIYTTKNVQGSIEQVVMIYADVTESHLQNTFQIEQNHILKQITNPDITLQETLNELTRFIEKISPQALASILLLDEAGNHLINGVGPSLSASYLDIIEGMKIGPDVGSCGTAAYTKKRVIVSDICNDPLWKNFKDVASDYNLHACWSQPIKDSSGQVIGTFAMYHQEPKKPTPFDLTLMKSAAELARNAIVHKQNLERITASEAQLLEAQKLANIGNWTLNLKDNTLTWSDEVYRIFEIDKSSFAASYEAFLDTIHPDDRERVNQAYTNSLKTKEPYEITHRLLMPDGRIKHVNECCETFFDYHGQPYKSLGTVQDITKSVIAQQEKENIQSKMEHVQRLESLGVLAGGIAHDFNNILTAILGNAELAQSKLSTASPIHDYIGNITLASHKAADLCKQMLAYSGKGQFVIKPVSLSVLIEEMEQLLNVSIAKNIVLRLDLSPQIPAIDADITQIQQVIMNLIINASEAIGSHSGAISLSTGVMRVDQQYLSETFLDEDLKEGQYVYLEVSDTGCGMSPDIQSKVFEPFFTTKFTGRGLGMAAILGIVRGHHGAIKVYSEENKGTTFKILFPSSQHTALPLTLKDKDANLWHGEGCILIIDDEETIREVAASMLKDMGLKTLQAADGIEGIAMFREHKDNITAVLLDMTMPRMGGEDTYSELCRINPKIKVILSSGYTEHDATNRFAGKGLAGFLQKPYTPKQLAEKLADILDKT